jgi:ribose 1,5-bisphosphokinase PhnN
VGRKRAAKEGEADGLIASRLRRKGNEPMEERSARLKRKKERKRRGFEFF